MRNFFLKEKMAFIIKIEITFSKSSRCVSFLIQFTSDFVKHAIYKDTDMHFILFALMKSEKFSTNFVKYHG